jgi:hypothetical protein
MEVNTESNVRTYVVHAVGSMLYLQHKKNLQHTERELLVCTAKLACISVD